MRNFSDNDARFIFPEPMGRINEFFSYRSTFSRVGLALAAAGAFLGLVSYAKGIQILMFVPALVLALFAYSFFERRAIRRDLRFSLRARDGNLVLSVRSSRPRAFFFRLALRGPDGAFAFLERREGPIPAWNVPPRIREGELVVLAKGSFDILRHRFAVPLPEAYAVRAPSRDADPSDGAGEYALVREYLSWDDSRRIEPLRSALRDAPYVRAPESVPAERFRAERIARKNVVDLDSDTVLRPRDESGRIGVVRFFLAACCCAVIAIQWEEPILTGILAATVAAVFAIGRFFPGIPRSRFAKNATVLVLFFLTLGVTAFMGDMTGAGAVFLTQILIVKRLFPDENEDGFLFFFLPLFVYVAVSLFSLAFWFILFFLGYLFLSALLLSTISGYVDRGALRSMVGTRVPWFRHAATAAVVSVMTGVFFFALPHGSAAPSVGTPLAGNANDAVSWFWGQIDLNDVGKIKKDTSKKIVVEDLGPGDIDRFGRAYWRGERFTRFVDGRWQKPWLYERSAVPFSTDSAASGSGAYAVTYYTLGTDRLFLPAAPLGVESPDFSGRLGAYVGARDSALYSLSVPLDAPLRVRAAFERGRSGEFVDAAVKFESFDVRMDPKIEKIFEEFWKGIAPDVAADPRKLERYVRGGYGFEYSIDAPARDLRSFLYEEKRGHCEYFATVLALSLQHFGYPATVVNGFYGGTANDIGNAWIIRGQDAHSWVEIYDAAKGWTRFDPTPSVSEEESVSLLESSKTLLVNVYDYLDLKWYAYVVGYTGDAQAEALVSLLRYRSEILLGFAGIAALAGCAWAFPVFLGRLREPPEDRLVRFFERSAPSPFFLDEMERTRPDLVWQTRRALYGRPLPDDPDLAELRGEWARTFARR